MEILLDTHIILWAANNNPKLPDEARNLLLDDANDIYFSVASLWEITIKHMNNSQKMPLTGAKLRDICYMMDYRMLKITDKHVEILETITREETAPPHHDPFDRLLISQAKAEHLTFLTHDSLLPYYNESCIKFV